MSQLARMYHLFIFWQWANCWGYKGPVRVGVGRCFPCLPTVWGVHIGTSFSNFFFQIYVQISLRLCVFTSFNFVKKFDFISKIWKYLAISCVSAKCKKHENHTWKKKITNACFFPAPKRFHSQQSIKIFHEQKTSNACLFPAPVRFHSHLSTLLKTLISFHV